MRLKRFISRLSTGISRLSTGICLLLALAIIMDVNIFGYEPSYIFWDLFIPVDIVVLFIVIVVEKVLEKRDS